MNLLRVSRWVKYRNYRREPPAGRSGPAGASHANPRGCVGEPCTYRIGEPCAGRLGERRSLTHPGSPVAKPRRELHGSTPHTYARPPRPRTPVANRVGERWTPMPPGTAGASPRVPHSATPTPRGARPRPQRSVVQPARAARPRPRAPVVNCMGERRSPACACRTVPHRPPVVRRPRPRTPVAVPPAPIGRQPRPHAACLRRIFDPPYNVGSKCKKTPLI